MSGTQRREHIQIGRALRLDRRSALELLRDLARDRAALADLRRLWTRESGATTLCFASDEQVLQQIAERVASGALVIARMPPALAKAPPPGEGTVDGAAAAEAAEEAQKEAEKAQEAAQKSWLELTVLSLSSGAPVSGVALLITLGSGSEEEHKTDEKGGVRLDGIAAGPCLVRCKMQDTKPEDALIFMGSAGGSPPPASEGAGGQKQAGTPCIVQVTRHKVKTGDTLESLAKSIGSTWQKLAKFNFGTDDPKKINSFLRVQVGCTKKTADGKNYLFDDSDEPGIILLPGEWKAEGMETGHAYTIEVVPAVEAAAWFFSM